MKLNLINRTTYYDFSSLYEFTERKKILNLKNPNVHTILFCWRYTFACLVERCNIAWEANIWGCIMQKEFLCEIFFSYFSLGSSRLSSARLGSTRCEVSRLTLLLGELCRYNRAPSRLLTERVCPWSKLQTKTRILSSNLFQHWNDSSLSRKCWALTHRTVTWKKSTL